MDPLSIIASVIAVAGAVTATSKLLATVIRLRHVPSQFVQLYDEISDIEAVLCYMSDVAADFEAQGGLPARQAIQLLDQAKITLDEIAVIMTKKILVQSSKGSDGPVEISKTGWFRYQRKLRELVNRLRDIRHNIDSLISTHTAKTLPRFQLDLQDIAVLSREISTNIRDFETTTLQRLDTMNTSFYSLQSLHSTLKQAATESNNLILETESTTVDEQDTPLVTKTSSTHSVNAAADVPLDQKLSGLGMHLPRGAVDAAEHGESIDSPSRRASSDTLVASEGGWEKGSTTPKQADQDESAFNYLVKASVYRPGVCRKHCACRCHRTRRAKTPHWAVAAVGSMFFGYTGSPILRYRTCNDATCQQNSQKSLRISYYFPRWFLDRMVELTCTWGPLDAHRISVRTPRLVAPDADVFVFASKGNVEGLHMLFKSGEASPFDVNALNGRSALNLATMEEQTSTCKFLLQAGANPQETDQIDRSPIDIVWNMMVREGRTERFRALIEIFKLDIEDGFDYLMTRKYTPLHQIIMGLKTHPSHDTNSLLALQLDFSRDEIDAQDTQGRTPLHWAVTRANAGAVRLLLAAGASIKLRDYKKQTPIHLCATVEWARVDCLAPLLFVAAQREWEQRIRVRPRQRDGALLVQSQFNSVIWKSKLLDDNNDYQGRTPALLAAYNDGDDKLDLLLRHHADIEITDFQGRTPLLFAIFRESVKCVGLLLAHDARTDAVDKHSSTILHYAARFGTLEILQLLRDGVHGVDVCARDKDGNTALDIFTNHRPKAPSPEESFTFKQLLEKSVLPKLTQPAVVPLLLSTEDGENSDLEQFFTAASSMEASRVNSLENSVEDIRTIDAERSGRLFFVPAIKQWVHKML